MAQKISEAVKNYKTLTASIVISSSNNKRTAHTSTALTSAAGSNIKKTGKRLSTTAAATGSALKRVSKRLYSLTALYVQTQKRVFIILANGVAAYAIANKGLFKTLLTGVNTSVVFTAIFNKYIQLIAWFTRQDYTGTITATDNAGTVTATDYTGLIEVVILSLQGNTVRLSCDFKDFSGVLTSPSTVVLKVYDKRHVQVGNSISLSPISTGHYEYDYPIPTGYTTLFAEFSGTISGKPIIGRERINVEWVEGE